jgi:uncharacterized membrane protein YkvA (DUF1232 family)
MKPLRMFFAARRKLPQVLPLMRDARVPLWAKVAAALAAVLIVSPLDLLGDIPVLGLLDDVALLMLVLHLFVTFGEQVTAPKQLVPL